MRLYFAGAEVPSWRPLLTDEGVVDMAMSYVGLARRVKFAKPWLVSEKFAVGTNVLLDSGALSLRDTPVDEQWRLADAYLDFVQTNIAAVEFAVEMDIPAFSRTQVGFHRDRMHELAGEKLIVVWHERDGLDELRELALYFPRIMITSTTISSRDITGHLTKLAHSGTQLFGAGMLKTDVMMRVPWYAVSGTSWISPAQYGETVVFTGSRVEQFHAREQDNARRRHHAHIVALGCDPEKVLADDRTENLRLSIRSWQAQLAVANKVVTNTAGATNSGSTDLTPETADNTTTETWHEPAPGRAQALPGIRLDMTSETYKDPDTGKTVTRDLPLLRRDDTAMRNCSNCRLATVPCPKFEEGASCAFNFPLELRTPQQLRAAQVMIAEMKVELLLKRRFEAELEGGHDLASVSKEFDTTFKLLKELRDGDQVGFKFTLEGRGGQPGNDMGVMRRIFARDAAPEIAPAPPPVTYAEVLDAEYTETD